MAESSAYGLFAEFETPEQLVAAAKQARADGYRKLDAFTPFPVPELVEIFELHDSRVLWLGLIGGFFGCAVAMFMQLYVNFDYPIDVGGRPQYALSAFAVVAFELTVLFAALFPAIGMLALNGLPRLNHPMFAARASSRASRDRFLLCILANDAKFDPTETEKFLWEQEPHSVELVTP
jgi:hypothetical protein